MKMPERRFAGAPVVGLLALLAGVGGAPAAEAQRGAQVSPTAREFAVKAAQGALAEVRLAELAQARSGNPAVRDFAARMIADHGAANAQLQQIARARGIPLPTEPDAEHQALVHELESKQGAGFDMGYLEAMQRDHDKDIRLFESATAATFPDPELRGFAIKTLAVIRQHRELLVKLQVNPGTAAALPRDEHGARGIGRPRASGH